MIRVKREILTKESNRYYLNSKLFTGVIFYLLSCEIERKKICNDGVITDDYTNEIITSDQCLEIDFDCLEGDDPYYPEFHLYKNKKFTGIAYGFNNNSLCTDEMLYFNGRDEPISSMGFSPSGQLISFDSDIDGFSQIFEWFESTKVKFIFLNLDGNIFSMSLNEKGELETLNIDKGYFSNIESIKNKSKFKIITKKSIFRSISASDRLYLYGDGIDDEIFYYLKLDDGLKNTTEISFDNTSLTSKNTNIS